MKARWDNLSAGFFVGVVMWTYQVTTGLMHHGNVLKGVGYSGHDEGLDNPNMENVRAVGPIPRGRWQIGTFFDHPHLGSIVAHLSPINTQVFGRSGFFIHGDNKSHNHSGSDGCIVADHSLREAIRDSGDKELSVI